MAEEAVEETVCHKKLVAEGRRHLAVKDYNAAVEAFARACDVLASEFGESADQCAEAYLWYGKALLGLSREESAGAVLGDGVPGTGNAEEDDDEEDGEEDENGEAEGNTEESEKAETAEKEKELKQNGECAEKSENVESTTKEEEPASSTKADGEAGTSNGEGDAMDASTLNMENDDDVDNLQLAWEMLDLSRSILERRVSAGGEAVAAAKALLAEAHLALGEVALESETYDKAVIDMQSCLELQKDLFRSDDRRIAETHYQIGLANSLASNFEDAITHFKNAANILESRIKMLEFPTADSEDASIKKLTVTDPTYSVEAEIKELKELLPEIQEKIQDMMDYKAETLRRVRETLCPTNGAETKAGGSSSSAFTSSSSGAGSSTAKPVSDISHLVRRKRKPSEEEDKQPAKRTNVDNST